MRYSSRTSVEYDLKHHYELRARYTEELKLRDAYKESKLKICNTNKGIKYYAAKGPGDEKFIYIGDSSSEVYRDICEYAYYEKAIEMINKNISLLEDFLKSYRRTSVEYITEMLPTAYRLSPVDAFYLMDGEADEWIRRGTSFKQSFPIFDPASLNVTAFDGTMMRSRAEALMYEAFFIYNVPVIYELPYNIDGETYRPDFTALDVYTMSDMMFEHLGGWYHSDPYKRNHYRTEAIHRWDEYAKVGFYPEINLFLTFESENKALDIRAMHRKISMLAVPPPSKGIIDMLRRQ